MVTTRSRSATRARDTSTDSSPADAVQRCRHSLGRRVADPRLETVAVGDRHTGHVLGVGGVHAGGAGGNGDLAVLGCGKVVLLEREDVEAAGPGRDPETGY